METTGIVMSRGAVLALISDILRANGDKSVADAFNRKRIATREGSQATDRFALT